MQTHVWRAGGVTVAFDRIIRKYDADTRREGFHVLHDWDGKADHVNEHIIPIDVLDYIAEQRGSEPPDRVSLAILLDYYVFHLLTLLAMRIWDEGDADDNLDRVGRLLSDLQSENGSGQRFVDDPDTLLLIATSHFEVQEQGYDALLARVRTLSRPHQLKIALGHAASMGSHLRFGFEATYARDTLKMRGDNIADYPWLCFAVATLMKGYADEQSAETSPDTVSRERVVESLLNGLTPDPRAFVGDAPAILASAEAERLEFRERFDAHRIELLNAFERYRPSEQRYSPMSFFFNFSHNVLKGTVVDALIWGEPWTVSFNDLLTAMSRTERDDSAKQKLATTLMTYARTNPDRIGGRWMPVIVYDPQAGRQAFATAMRQLKSA